MMTTFARPGGGLQRFGAVIGIVFGALAVVLFMAIFPATFIVTAGIGAVAAIGAIGFYAWVWLSPRTDRG
jgi:hypothetical protein